LLTRIGTSTTTPSDAVDLLVDCHARIRHFLAVARGIAERGPSDPAAVPEAAAAVVRYFTKALPLHARDEEDSIVPRLRGRDAEVDRALDQMLREHGEHDAPLGALVAACEALASGAGRLAELGPVVARETTALERHFDEHLRNEEAVIFPAMRRLLDRDADAAIVRELRARRDA
jgi:hemerythrin-like domain-containing protein